MSPIYPILTVLLAVIAWVVFRNSTPTYRDANSEKTESRDQGAGQWIALGFLLIAAYLVTGRIGIKGFGLDQTLAIGIGAVAVALASLARNVGTGFALGLAGATIVLWVGSGDRSLTGFAAMLGAGLAAMVFSSPAAAVSSVGIVASLAASVLIVGHSDSATAPLLGPVIGISAIIGLIAGFNLVPKLGLLRPLLVATTILIGGYFASRQLDEKYFLLTLTIGIVGGLVSHLMLQGQGQGQESGPDSLRIGIAGIIALAEGTVTFGMARGAGMALALLAGTMLIVSTNNRRALLAQGPLIGLVLYRLLKEGYPDVSRALDIGQHYAMLGLLVGVIVPLLPGDWLKVKGWQRSMGAILWGTLIIGFPWIVILMFGAKGAVGFVVGLGFAGMIQALRGEESLLPLAVAGGLTGSLFLLLSGANSIGDWNRDDKVRYFAYSMCAILTVSLCLFLIHRTAVRSLNSDQMADQKS